MHKRETLQLYINDFRRHLAPFLRPSVGLRCAVYPANGAGAVIEFTIGPGVSNEDHFSPPSLSINDALSLVKQRAFGGNLRGFHFGGTNVVMEENRIILIKGEESPSHWDNRAARNDVQKILHRPVEGVRK
jgi:hypothetical protein